MAKFTILLPLSLRREQFQSQDGHGHDSGSGETREMVRVTMNYPASSSGSTGSLSNKEITLRLTSDENPTFFFHLNINEGEYQGLKNEQGLLVDFFGFPKQLLTLLKRCDPHSRDENDSELIGGPKFLLVMKLSMNGFILDFVESNPFKYLSHLSLRINQGTDAEVKKYLAEVTHSLKKDQEMMQNKYMNLSSQMNEEITNLREKLEEKCEETNRLRQEINFQSNSISSKFMQELALEKEKSLKLQTELSGNFDNHRREIEKREYENKKVLEDKLSLYEKENRDLTDLKSKNQSTIDDLYNRLKHYENDVTILQKEITLARKHIGKLDSDYHDKELQARSLQSKLNSAEEELRGKRSLNSSQEELIRTFSEQKKALEIQNESLTRDLEKHKNLSKSCNSELMKGNEIIKKLQNEIRNTHKDKKLERQKRIELEELAERKEKEMVGINEDLKKLKEDFTHFEAEMEAKTKLLEETEKKVEAQEEVLKTKETLISWLNKQLNELQGLGNLSRFRQNLEVAKDPERFGLRDASELENRDSTLRGISFEQDQSVDKSKSLNQNSYSSPAWMNIYKNSLKANDSRVEAHQGSIKESTLLENDSSRNVNGNINEKDKVGGRGRKLNPKRQPTWVTNGNSKVTLDALINKPTFPIWKS